MAASTSRTPARSWRRGPRSWWQARRSLLAGTRKAPPGGLSRLAVELLLGLDDPGPLRRDRPDGDRLPRRVFRLVRGRTHRPAAGLRFHLSRARAGGAAPSRDRDPGALPAT